MKEKSKDTVMASPKQNETFQINDAKFCQQVNRERANIEEHGLFPQERKECYKGIKWTNNL